VRDSAGKFFFSFLRKTFSFSGSFCHTTSVSGIRCRVSVTGFYRYLAPDTDTFLNYFFPGAFFLAWWLVSALCACGHWYGSAGHEQAAICDVLIRDNNQCPSTLDVHLTRCAVAFDLTLCFKNSPDATEFVFAEIPDGVSRFTAVH